jgi:hypothetical protein
MLSVTPNAYNTYGPGIVTRLEATQTGNHGSIPDQD